ncbi:hypothetical protein ABZX95_48385 [Streptomyces sp. NPDC004232]|uniref:hypothetical protein n=1 Tax=Streptomyces sp. NPDC004232 TaxID=3154454 RepID=UPI0033B82529
MRDLHDGREPQQPQPSQPHARQPAQPTTAERPGAAEKAGVTFDGSQEQRRTPARVHNPVEGVGAHVKRSLVDVAVVALDRLEVLVRNRLKRLQYRLDTLDAFMAGTGLTLDESASP